MHALYVARDPENGLQAEWEQQGIGSTYVSSEYLLDVLNDPVRRQALAVDVVAILSDRLPDLPEPWRGLAGVSETLAPADAVLLAVRLRQMPENAAMPDGRKWNALPIVVFTTTDVYHAEAAGAIAAANLLGILNIESVKLSGNFSGDANVLKAAVKRYRQDILNELDRLGFVVRYDGGRYRLGPALKPRAELAGHYYFGPADQRRAEFVTIDRDCCAIQLEIELLEALINRVDVSEADLQKFFEEYPHFLSTLAMPLPHVQLRDTTGKLLVPDFILKPVVAARRDSRWEVLDLKRPQAALIVGKGSRRRLSHEVMSAIRQLRDYGDYFADPRHADNIHSALGHQLRRPKLGVLIGRLTEPNIEALELEQARLPDVRVVTYDEILEQQKSLV